MLHWSQDASTGWTRNSWVWSRVTKRTCLSCGARQGDGKPRRRDAPTARRLPSRGRACIAGGPGGARSAGRPARGGARPGGPARRSTRRAASRRRARRALAPRARVDSRMARSYAGRVARAGPPACARSHVSPSEIAFLAVGLILGAGVGAAVVEALRARPAPASPGPDHGLPELDRASRRAHAVRGDAHRRHAVPSPDRPPTAAGRTTTTTPRRGRSRRRPRRPRPARPGRTPVPSMPAGLPAGAVAVPVQGAASIPVGPGAMTMARHGSGPDDAEPRTPRRPRRPAPPRVAVLDEARPAVPPQPSPRPATVSAVDVGPTAPGVAVRPRPPVAVPRRPSPRRRRGAGHATVGAGSPAARPTTSWPGRWRSRPRPPTRATCRAGSWTSAARSRPRRASTRRRPPMRCARRSAPTTSCASTSTAPSRAPTRARSPPRRTSSIAGSARRATARPTAEAAEAAARDVAGRDQRAQHPVREAARFLQTGGAELRAAGPRIERLAVEADAARISAEGAEVGCRDARERLADCEEAEARGPEPVAPTGADEPHPFDAAWPGESESTRTQPLDEPSRCSAGRACRSSSGSCAATARPATASWPILAGTDAEAARDVAAPPDRARRRDRGARDRGRLPRPARTTTRSGACSRTRERREIVGALSALGYRFDGLGGFADGRVPAARDLALAVGYAGLDRMRIRTWPRESESRALYEQALGRRGRVAGRPGRRPVARPDGRRARRPGRGPRRRLERLGPGPARLLLADGLTSAVAQAGSGRVAADAVSGLVARAAGPRPRRPR